jgi:hypothetical protein
MHKIGREGRRVFTFVHRLVVEVVSNSERLQNCRNNACRADILVRLNAG